jgi:hypothetical protein
MKNKLKLAGYGLITLGLAMPVYSQSTRQSYLERNETTQKQMSEHPYKSHNPISGLVDSELLAPFETIEESKNKYETKLLDKTKQKEYTAIRRLPHEEEKEKIKTLENSVRQRQFPIRRIFFRKK